jgi:hypothetical protein
MLLSLLALPLLTGGCDLTKIGAYTCDEYCDQVVGKAQTCAQDAIHDECVAAGESNCDEMTQDQIADYISQARDDWKGKGKQEMIDSCNDDITAAGKTDASCQAETATINNLSCDDILGLIGDIAEAAH